MKYFTFIATMALAAAGASAAAPEASVKLVAQPLEVEAQQALAKPMTTATTAEVLPNAGTRVQFALPKEGGVFASYEEPTGLFTMGLSETNSGYSIPFRRGGAHIPYTFTNTSSDYTRLEWSYPPLNGDSVSVEEQITVVPPYTVFDAPVLTAFGADGSSSEYSHPSYCQDVAYFSGGNATGYTGDLECGVTMYQNVGYKDADGYGYTSGSIYSYPLGNTEQGTWLRRLPEGSSSPQITAYCNLFPAPNSPYYITKLWTWFNVTTSEPIALTAHINKYVNGDYSEELARGEAIVDKGGMLVFDLVALDEDGLETEEPITISDSIMVVIDGFDGADGLTAFNPVFGTGSLAPVVDGYVQLTHEEFASYRVEFTDAEGNRMETMLPQPSWYYSDDTQTSVLQFTSLTLMMDATYAWFYVPDGKTQYEVSKEGGVVTLPVRSYWNLSAVSAYLPDFITNVEYEEINDESSDANFNIYLTVGELPEGETGRTDVVSFTAPGVKQLDITIVQGENSIDGVEADKEVKSVEYYDVMGRVLNAEPVSGMFVRKQVMTDGSVKAVKVVK